MSIVRTFLLACALLLAAAFPALAGNGGSTYSVLGLGDLRYLPGARNAGMGYTGIGLSTTQYINSTAPATWARINRTRIDAGVLYEGFNGKDAHTSRYLSTTNFSGAMMAIPISPLDGIVMVAGFTPYSNVDYNLVTKGTYQSGTDQIDYTLRHVGTGGLGQAQLGSSWGPSDQWSIGASVSYVFGTIDNATTMVATQTTVATGVGTATADIHGVLANVGFLYSGFGGAFRPLSIGVNLTTPGTFHSSREKSFLYNGGGQSTPEYDTLDLPDGTIKVPLALGVGISWTLAERLVFAADYRTQAWGSSEFYGEHPVGIRNSQMAGIGFEHLASRDASASFWNHIAYRLGAVYNATYYEVKGVPINEMIGTAGVSVPISGDTKLNVSAEYGVRGKTSGNLVKENVFRLNFSLTLGEAWFVRPEED